MRSYLYFSNKKCRIYTACGVLQTPNEGIKLRGGNPGMSFEDLINSYHNAYNNPSLDGIRGDLRTPDSSIVVATNVTPGDAFKELLKWGNNN